MALILNLETATKVCSVALASDGELLAFKESNDAEYSHSEKLTLFIQDVLKEAGKQTADLNAVAVSKGPGSYTGLRIGISTAKGLCYGLEIPLISIETLKALTFNPLLKDTAGLLCPMIDARRMEVYCAVYDEQGTEVRAVDAVIVEENSFDDQLEKSAVTFFGDGAPKCEEVLGSHANTSFRDDIFPSAKYMVAMAEEAFNNKAFEDVAYFEPYYLKDFIATTPKKLV